MPKLFFAFNSLNTKKLKRDKNEFGKMQQAC